MTYNEWLTECGIPFAVWFMSTILIGSFISYKADKFFNRHKRQIALWIGKHIYHEDWSVEK